MKEWLFLQNNNSNGPDAGAEFKEAPGPTVSKPHAFEKKLSAIVESGFDLKVQKFRPSFLFVCFQKAVIQKVLIAILCLAVNLLLTPLLPSDRNAGTAWHIELYCHK